MIKFLIPVTCLILGLSTTLQQEHTATAYNIQHSKLNPDSAEYQISPILDSLGLLDGYKVLVFTPICEVEQCYSVELNFYTDAIGNFLSYDTLKGKELTKLDHIPFTDEDYQRLQNILSDRNSVLSGYEKEELVRDTRESEIEGFTGATVLEVKRNVIEGAVYSCHTLWHIAHGPLVDSLKAHTASRFDQDLVNKLVSQNNQQVNYFLLNSFSEQDYAQYLPAILQTIDTGTGYYPKNALEKIPASVLNSSTAQEFFAPRFLEMDYFTQVALLKKLNGQQLGEPLKEVLVRSIEERSSLREQLINRLID